MNFTYSIFPIPSSNSGGFTFLHKLKLVLEKKKGFVCKWDSANIVLLNSHHWISSLLKIIFLRNKGTKFVLRIDGPLNLYRNSYDSYLLDLLIYSFAVNFCSGVIYQSKWSYLKNIEKEKKLVNLPSRIIYNGSETLNCLKKRKEICLYMANSNNKFKGFETFKKLAEQSSRIESLRNLQFYAIGNIPKQNNKLININYLGSLSKKKLSEFMQICKYYIHPSIYEACSNALIESINHGLIPLVFNGSSNIEIVKDNRLQFNNIQELLLNLEKIHRAKEFIPTDFEIKKLKIEDSAKEYLKFFKQIINEDKSKTSLLNLLSVIKIFFYYISVKVFLKIFRF